jgi:outer membrane protein OmpA-like peptidoglycan-associated protein
MVGAPGPAAPQQAWSTIADFLFDYDKADVRPSETPKVDKLIQYMKQNPNVEVGLDGYTDPRGTPPYNQKLSQRRVDAVNASMSIPEPSDAGTEAHPHFSSHWNGS